MSKKKLLFSTMYTKVISKVHLSLSFVKLNYNKYSKTNKIKARQIRFDLNKH